MSAIRSQGFLFVYVGSKQVRLVRCERCFVLCITDRCGCRIGDRYAYVDCNPRLGHTTCTWRSCVFLIRIVPTRLLAPPVFSRTLVHVSTAFVHGGNSGTASFPLPQQLPDLGGRNPERLYRSAQNSRVVGGGGDNVQSAGGPGKEAVEAMADLGYPNTYTFTKALGEHLLARALNAHNRKLDMSAAEQDSYGDGRGRGAGAEEAGGRGASSSPGPRRLRLRVVRPSIVGPSWVFPWPGWTGEQPSTVTGAREGCGGWQGVEGVKEVVP